MYLIPWVNKCNICDFELITNEPPKWCPNCIDELYKKMNIGEMQYLRHITNEELQSAND